MGENTVLEKSFHFAVRMVALNKYLVQEKKEFVPIFKPSSNC
jgi:hypothetical protein